MALVTARCLVTIVLAAACGGMQDPSTVEQQQGACIELEGRRFESLSELECGLGPNGIHLCRWSVSFATRDDTSSTFQWSHSDVGESGQVECNGTAITSVRTSRQVSGAYDPISGRLYWQGESYTPAP
jgi:hypothetical protein